MGAGSSVDMATAGLDLPGAGPPPPGADADFDALVEAEMRKRTSGTEPGIAPPPPRGADPAFDAMVEAEMVRQRGFAESYAARNRDLFDRDRAADDARIRAAVERASDRRAYDAPQSSEPPPQPQKPFAPLGAAPEPFKPTGDPRRDAKLAYAAALREQMAAPKSSLRRSWGYGALPDDDALRSPPREKAPPRDDVPAPGPLGGAYALRPEQEPRRLSYPQQPSPERLAREDYARDLERQMREREARDRAAKVEAASPPPRRAPVGAFPGAAAAAAPPAAFSPPMKQAADHALQGRRDARAKHVREVYGATGVAAAAFGAPGAEAPAARAKSITRPRDAGQEQDRRARALEQKAALEAQMRANREAKEAADRKRREEDAAEDAKWAAKEAEDRRRREEGERAKKQAEQQRLDDLYAQQEADAKKRRNRRHEERTTPLRSPAPRSPRQPPSAQLRSPASPAVVNTQARRTPPASPPVPSLAAQKVPAALVRASAAPGTKISDDDLERAASDFEARVAAELERFQDDRRRRVARAALPQNAGGALEALAEKIQQAPDLRTLAGMPPAAPRPAAAADELPHISAEDDWGETSLAGESTFVPLPERVARAEAAYTLADTPPASAGALSPDAIADRWQRDHPLPGAKARRGPAARASRRQNTVEQSLAGESSFHAFIDPADEAITSPAPPETFEDLADRIPDESFDSTLGA